MNKIMPYLAIESQSSPSFIRYSPHKIHPSRRKMRYANETAVNGSCRKSIFCQVNHLIIKVHPIIIFGFNIHGQVIVEKVKRKWKHTSDFLIFQVKRSSFAKSGQQ